MFGKKDNSKKTASPKNAPKIEEDEGMVVEEVDMRLVDGMLKKEIRDEDITLTDADMDDPDLLSQLMQIESGAKLERPKQNTAPQQPQRPAAAPQQPAVRKPAPKKLTPEEEEEAMLQREFGEFNDGDGDQEEEGGDLDEMIEIVSRRHAAYKQLALEASRAGDRTQAVTMMKSVKLLAGALTELNEGIPIDMSTMPPEIKAPTARPIPVHVPAPKIEIISREQLEHEERVQTWELFEEDFKKKYHTLTSEALRLKNIDKHQAISCLRDSKSIMAIIEQIERCKAASMPPPPFHFEEKVTQVETIQTHLKDNELEITIGAFEFPKSVNADTYITGEMPYPSSEAPFKFQTPSVSCTAKDYGFKVICNIERKKTLERSLKKKITLVIYASRMFFMKSVVGRCEIKLSDLLDKTEYVERVPKELGGFLEITVRMRTPFNGKEIKKTVEKALVLDGPISKEVVVASQPTTTTNVVVEATTITTPVKTPSPPPSVPTTPITPTTPVTPIATTTTTTSTTTTSTPTPQPKPTPAKKEEEEEEEEDIDSLDRVVSNDVMDNELEKILAIMATKGANAELLDRKQAIELKKMVLETQVDSGVLTVEGYTQQVQEAILKDQILAKKLMQEGKKDQAVRVMARVKIMRNELDQ
eukprot:gene6252-7249_t